jgi:hypothetical protein
MAGVGLGLLSVASFRSWTEQHWSEGGLYEYAKQFEWSDEMHAAVRETATRALAEVARLEDGIESLKDHADLRRAFELMNDAMSRASQNARGEPSTTAGVPSRLDSYCPCCPPSFARSPTTAL